MIANLLIIVCLAFLFCFALGLQKQQFEAVLPKIFRKDRIQDYSIFQIGKRIFAYLKKKRLCVSKQFTNNFSQNFCLR